MDNATANHYSTATYSAPLKPWTEVYQNKMCHIFKISTTVVVVKKVSGAYTLTSDLSTALSGLTLDANTKYQFSDDCSRAYIGGRLLYLPTGGSWTVFTIPSGTTLTSIDSNITLALTSTSKVLRIHVSNASFTEAFVPPVGFPTGAMIETAGPRVAVYAKNATSAWFVGFDVSNGRFEKCINYSFPHFTTPPVIESSPSLDKVVIFGKVNPPAWAQNQNPFTKVDMYFI